MPPFPSLSPAHPSFSNQQGALSVIAMNQSCVAFMMFAMCLCSRSKERGVSLPLVRYIVDYEFDESVPQPVPRVLPAKHKDNPHDFVKALNGGYMPYSKNSAPLALSFALMGLDCGAASSVRQCLETFCHHKVSLQE